MEEKRKPGRPKGSRSKPGSLKTGKPAGYATPQHKHYTPDEVLEFKTKILSLIQSGEAETLSEAAKKLNVPPLNAHYWRKNDSVWKEDLRLAFEVLADKLEKEILERDMKYAQIFARIFLLNGLRPERYRKDYKLLPISPKVEVLLAKLQVAGEIPEASEAIEGEFREITPKTEETKSVSQLIEETVANEKSDD